MFRYLQELHQLKRVDLKGFFGQDGATFLYGKSILLIFYIRNSSLCIFLGLFKRYVH